MKKILFAICSLMILINNNISFAKMNDLKLPEDKGMYIVIAPTDQDEERYCPLAQICKLDIKVLNDNKTDTKVVSVNKFKTKMTEDVDIFYDYQRAIIKTNNETDGYFIDLNIINFNRPWSKKIIFKEDATNLLYPAILDKKEVLISYDADKIPIIKSYDLETLNQSLLKPEQIASIPGEDNYFLIEDNGRVKYEIWGMENYYYPICPPANLLENKKEFFIRADTKHYLVLGLVKDKKEKGIYVVGLNKVKNKWCKYTIQCDSGDYKIYNDIFIYHSVNEISKQNKPDEYIGEWAIINLEKELVQTIELDVEDSIVYADHDYIIVVSGNQLLYYPVINNKIDLTKEVILYEDKDYELVPYIKGVFFGPKEIPASLTK